MHFCIFIGQILFMYKIMMTFPKRYCCKTHPSWALHGPVWKSSEVMTSYSHILTPPKQDYFQFSYSKSCGCNTCSPWALDGPARRITKVMTSFSHILIKIKTICILVFSQNRFCQCINCSVQCEISYGPASRSIRVMTSFSHILIHMQDN